MLIRAGALLSTIHPFDRHREGGIDANIRLVAREYFHAQVLASTASDGRVVIARKNPGKAVPPTEFGAVVFVMDAFRKPLHDIIYAGLVAAVEGGFPSITVPMIRMGDLGAFEKTADAVLTEIAAAYQAFAEAWHYRDFEVIFVVFDNHATIVPALRRKLGLV